MCSIVLTEQILEQVKIKVCPQKQLSVIVINIQDCRVNVFVLAYDPHVRKTAHDEK